MNCLINFVVSLDPRITNLKQKNVSDIVFLTAVLLSFPCFITTGTTPTIADYYVTTLLLQLEWLNFEFQLWPKLLKWMNTFKELELWKKVHEKHDGFVKELKKQAL